MPKKSAASLAVVAPVFGRPEPPPELQPSEAEVWRSVVATKPADWFTRDTHPLLTGYCRAAVAADLIAAQVKVFDPAWLATDDGLGRYNQLMKMAQRQASLLATLATKMRLAQQSKYGARGAETQSRAGAAVKPWERTQQSVAR